jgi:hypothetical protein
MQFDQLKRRKFITLLVGARRRGRSGRARSRQGFRSSATLTPGQPKVGETKTPHFDKA